MRRVTKWPLMAYLAAILVVLSLAPRAAFASTRAGALAPHNCAFAANWDGSSTTYSGNSIADANGWITTNTGTVCSGTQGVSAWVMVARNGVGYTQAGWVTYGSGHSGPWQFAEWASQSCGSCYTDAYYNAASGNTGYDTHINQVSGSQFALYVYINGGLVGNYGLDWTGWGNATAYDEETHSTDDTWGPDNFTSLRYCSISGGTCSNTVYNTASSNSNGSTPFACYSKTGTDSFKTYDTRNNGGHC